MLREWARKQGYPQEAVKKYGAAEPTLLIIGEEHNLKRDKKEQAALLEVFQPELVFHEACANYIYDRARRRIERDETYQIREDAKMFMDEKRKWVWDLADSRQRKQFDGTRFGQWLKREQVSYDIDSYDLTELYIPVFKYPGAHHGMFLDALPFCVTKVIGSDLARGEVNYLSDILGFDKIKTSEITPSKEAWFLEREQRMADIFLRYNSNRLSVAILGNSHIRETSTAYSSSAIHTVLQEKNISYLCLSQKLHPDYKPALAFETAISNACFWIKKQQMIGELYKERIIRKAKDYIKI